MVLSRTSSRRRSFRLIFLLEALRATTVGMTPEDAAEMRVKDDVEEEEEEEEAVLLLDDVDEARASAWFDVLSRVDLRDVAGMLISEPHV